MIRIFLVIQFKGHACIHSINIVLTVGLKQRRITNACYASNFGILSKHRLQIRKNEFDQFKLRIYQIYNDQLLFLKTLMTSSTSKLNQRFQEITKSLQMEKIHRHQAFQLQLQSLERKLDQQIMINEKVQHELKERITNLKAQISKIQQTNQSVESSIQAQIMKIQENFMQELEKEKSQRRFDLDELTKTTDEKILKICHSMQEVTNQKGENIENIADKMCQKISQLQERINGQRKRRQENTNQLSEAVEKQIGRLYSQLEKNKKIREQTHSKIIAMAKQIEKKLEGQIDVEKQARKATNKAILALLEETCSKIQKVFY